MKRSLWLCLSIIVAAIALHGCASQAPAPKVEMTYIAPNYDALGIKSVAILPLANITGQADAENILGNAIEAQLVTRTDYSFTTVEGLTRKCSAAGLSPDLESLRRQWVHTRQFKPDLSRKIADELKIDAILIGEISLWKKEDLRPETAGYPHSDVGCRVYLMNPRTGDKLWEAYCEKIVKGQYYDPTEEQMNTYVDEAGIVRGSGGKPITTIEAPPIREVADQVAADIVAALPKVSKL